MAMGFHKRCDKHSIMANSGFGALTIHRKDGSVIVVPQNQITKAGGLVKKVIRHKLWNFTPERINLLEKRGVKLFVEGKVG